MAQYLELKAPNTKRAYIAVLKQFCAKNPNLIQVTSKDAMKYFLDLKQKDLAGATIKLHFQCLNSIYNYLKDLEILDRNPLRPVARAISWRDMAQVRPTAILPFATPRKLLRLFPDDKKGRMKRAIIAILFGSGLRRSELLGLNIEDIQITPQGLMVLDLRKTKGGKRQTRVLARFAWKYLSRYISQRKTDGAENHDPLFVFYYQSGAVRGRLDQKTLYRYFRDACAVIGLKAAPHAARAAFASKIHADTGSDLLAARALGHATTKQVGIYVKERENYENLDVTNLSYCSKKKKVVNND